MLETAATGLTALADRYGLVVLLVAFVLEGALVGKLLPTRGALIGVAVATGTSGLDYVAVFAAAVVGATTGQLLLFLAVRWFDFDPTAHDRIPVGPEDVRRAERWIGRWGPAAIAISNALPVARGTLTVPTAMGRVHTARFGTYSVLGTCLYVGALVVVALGVGGVLSSGSPTVALVGDAVRAVPSPVFV